MRFGFYSKSHLYNTRITQEADWVVNGVRAADVSAYATNSNGVENFKIPDFVDVDGLNKAAKQNIVMNGNIAFGGDGFTWESLMLLCNALQLNEGKSVNGFKQSSDKKFTYYTITLCTNPFEYNPEAITNNTVYAPTTRLIATFDPLTQVCVNWTIDTYTSYTSFSNKTHDISEPINVNVHEYQVDTNNYAAMRETIKTWITNNSLKTTTEYCVIDMNDTKNKNKIVGTVDTGWSNILIEPIVDGVTYYSIDAQENNDGTVTGLYVSAEDYAYAETLETQGEIDAYLYEHAHNWKIMCCVLDENGEIVAQMKEGTTKLIADSGEPYYIADYELTESGYKDVRLLTESMVSQLLMLYTKTYKLSEEQNTEIQNVFRSSGVVAVKDYVDELFADAEEAQKQQQENQGNATGLVKDGLAKNQTLNTEVDLSTFVIAENSMGMNDLTSEQLEAIGFTSNKESPKSFVIDSDVIAIGGTTLQNEGGNELGVLKTDGGIAALFVNSNHYSFYNGLKVGMTKEEATTTIGNEQIQWIQAAVSEVLIFKNANNTLVVYLDADGKFVENILLINNALLFE